MDMGSVTTYNSVNTVVVADKAVLSSGVSQLSQAAWGIISPPVSYTHLDVYKRQVLCYRLFVSIFRVQSFSTLFAF